VQEVIEKVIPIPRMLIQQSGNVRCGFHDFDLDTRNLNYQPVSEEIIRRTLRTNESEVLQSQGSGIIRDTSTNIIVAELMNYPEVDYDREPDLLCKIAGQAVTALAKGKSDEELRNIVLYHKRDIGQYIYTQLKQHFYLEAGEFEEPKVYPFTKIEPHNFSMYTRDSIHGYTETITPTNTIPSKVFGGFKKACHSLYKFDSKAEKDFAAILESDPAVLRWLRPAQAQFAIYWRHNSRRYVPDFVVETKDAIYLIEIKAENEINESDVQEKAQAGNKYCQTATQFNEQNRGKPWKYVLIPHSSVTHNMTVAGLVSQCV